MLHDTHQTFNLSNLVLSASNFWMLSMVSDVDHVQPHPQLSPGQAHQAVTLGHHVTIIASQVITFLLKSIFEISWDIGDHMASNFESHSALFNRFVMEIWNYSCLICSNLVDFSNSSFT